MPSYATTECRAFRWQRHDAAHGATRSYELGSCVSVIHDDGGHTVRTELVSVSDRPGLLKQRFAAAGGVVLGVWLLAGASQRSLPRPATRAAAVDGTPDRPRGALVATGVGRSIDSVDHHAVNAVVYNGWKMFEVYCTRCHGEDAVGSSFAPALIKSVGPDGTVNHRVFFETVTQGRPAKGMPTWGNLLSPEQKEDIWNYLRARAVGGLAPGRPHTAPGANRDSTVLPKALGQDTTWPGPPPNS
jgi:mono/diheme cytochrome c family protein